MKRMKEVSFLVDEDTENKNISLKVTDKSGVEYDLNSFTYRYVDIEEGYCEKYELSDSEAGAIKRLVEDSARNSSIMSFAPMAPPSRKEFEALRSRVEKLERESERQCARVTKMQESVFDDLK